MNAHHDLTQCDEVLRHLESGRSITPREASRLYGIERLGARIYELRCQGHQITSQMVKVRRRNGGHTRVASYSLIR